MATLQDVYDQTYAALDDDRFADAAQTLAVLEQYAEHIQPSTLANLRTQTFVGLWKAGEPTAARAVLARAHGADAPRYASLAEVARTLASTDDLGEARVCAIYAEAMILVAGRAEHSEAAELLAAGMNQALPGPFERVLGELVHEQVPAPWWPALLTRATEQLEQAATWIEALGTYAAQDAYEDIPEAIWLAHGAAHPYGKRCWIAIDDLYPMLINVLSQHPEALAGAVEDAKLAGAVRALERFHPNIHHLRTCLQTLPDAPFLILHPRRRQGFEVRVRGVNHMQSFQTLMHAAIHGDPREGLLAAPRPDPAIVRTLAATDTPMQGGAVTSNVWGLFFWPALRDSGSLTGFDTNAGMRDNLRAQLGDLVADDVELGTNFGPPDDADGAAAFEARAGELPAVEAPDVELDPDDPAPFRYKVDDQGRPDMIPTLDGRGVILLTGRTTLSRWQPVRQFPYMCGEFVVEAVLSPAQVDAALARIRAAMDGDEPDYLAAETKSWKIAGISERNIAGPDRARPILARAFEFAERLGDAAELVEIAQLLAPCLDHDDDPRAAVQLWQRALVAMGARPDAQAQVLASVRGLFMLGEAHDKLGEHAAAKDAYFRARTCFDDLDGYQELRGMVLTALGDAHRRLGDFASAREAWRAAIDAYYEADPIVGPARAQISLHRKLANLDLQVDDDPHAAIRELLDIVELVDAAFGQHHPERAFAWETAAQLLEIIDEHEQAAAYFAKADAVLAAARHAVEHGGLVAAAMDGSAAAKAGRMAIALRRYQRYLELAVELHGADSDHAIKCREIIASIQAEL